MVSPGGLAQIFYTLRDNLLRKVADRRGIVVPSLVADRRVEEKIELGAFETASAAVGDGNGGNGKAKPKRRKARATEGAGR